MGQITRSILIRPSVGLGVAVAIWATSALGVWLWMTQYACSGNRVNRDPKIEVWPADSELAKSDQHSTLLLFLHPRCPCTAAVISELRRVLSCANYSFNQRPKVILVSTVPTNATQDWFDSNTMQLAKQLPEVEVYWDVGGKEAQLFAATNSGTIRLYRYDGKLLFSGGITISRGHEGASSGGDALLSVLNNPSQPSCIRPPVFGCQLCIEDTLQAKCMMKENSQRLVLTEGASE